MHSDRVEALLKDVTEHERLVLLAVALQTSNEVYGATSHKDVMALCGLELNKYNEAMQSLQNKGLVFRPENPTYYGYLRCELSRVAHPRIHDPSW